MNIVHICSVSAKPSGIKTVLKKISAKQREYGNTVRVLSLNISEPDFKHINTLRDFYNEIQKSRPDIVVFHSVYYLMYIPFSLLLRKNKIPYAVELHGALSIENYKVSYIKKVIANFIYFRRFLANACGIIYLNDKEYQNSIVKDINKNYVVVPNGCDVIENQYNNSGGRSSKIEVLYVGRIERYHKGLDVLLSAIRILLNRQMADKMRFVFYGDGDESECVWFKEQIADISGIAEFNGPIYGKSKEIAMCKSDIFILTSRSEGMPMGVLEALSYGLPCILTVETNLGEEIEEAGAGWITTLLPEDIADTISVAIEDYQNNRDHLSMKALKMSKRYSWSVIAQNSIEKYQLLLNKNKCK